MCTVILSIEPGAPVLLAGIRVEFTGRAWQPPAQHWPEYPGLIGGRDLLAGGTWLAVAPAVPRVACVLNGRGMLAPAPSRRSRGVLPLRVAASGTLERSGLAGFDPFHLLSAEPHGAVLWSWDGEHLTERGLGAGLHIVVNSGLAGELPATAHRRTEPPMGQSVSSPAADHELARIGHFLPLLRAAARPSPRPDGTVAGAWGDWLPLMNGAGVPPQDPRALIVQRDLGDGRVWGTTSVSLVSLSQDGLRYDFTGTPGGGARWYPVPLGKAA